MRAALDEAYAVFRSLGATLEDVRIRPAADYYAVKITIAESEQYAIHEEELRTRPGDFGADFLGRALPAVLYSGADYVQAQRERRLMLAEMAPIYEKYDLLVTPTAPGPAPRLGTWRTISFWQNSSLTTPFNVTGGPALAQCMGFTPTGLPLSLQLVGRPFDEATVLRAAHAYETATNWRQPQAQPRSGGGLSRPNRRQASGRSRSMILRCATSSGRLPPCGTVLERRPDRHDLRRGAVCHGDDPAPPAGTGLPRGTGQYLPISRLTRSRAQIDRRRSV